MRECICKGREKVAREEEKGGVSNFEKKHTQISFSFWFSNTFRTFIT